MNEKIEETAPVPPPADIPAEVLAQIPDPEEIMRQAAEEARQKQIEAHNLGVEMARADKLLRRRERRIKSGRANRGDLNALQRKPGLNKPKRHQRSATPGM